MNNFPAYMDAFFWDDIRKENTNFNFLILTHLCKLRKVDAGNGYLLNKPILIMLVSIVECILYDLIKRISNYEYHDDPLPGIDFISVINCVDIMRAQNVCDTFEQVILYFEERPRLLEVNKQVYEQLHVLRKLRNRVHIQVYNKKNKSENNMWTEEKIQSAGKILEELCAILSSKFSRPNKEIILTTLKFPKPWQS
jgi:hypothetical protein